jgi:hypothetical protein
MIFLVVFLAMILVVGMMAVGVIMGRKPIAGSCGGIANLGIENARSAVVAVRSAKRSIATRAKRRTPT